MSKPHTDHDKLFKFAFQDIESAREFFENFLSPEILGIIDLKKLRLDPTNYISATFQEDFADIVLGTLFFKSKNTLILLIDHKTRIDRTLVVQMLSYVLSILSLNIKNKKPYSFVLPIVVYHGDRKSDPKPLHTFFKKLPPFLQKFIPSLNFIFVNLGTIPNAKLLKLSNETILKSTFLMLKNAEDGDFLRKNFSEILDFKEKNENYLDFVKTIALYLYDHSTLERTEVDELFLEHDKKNRIMKAGVGVAGKELRAEGFIQGNKQGRNEKTIAVVRRGWLKGYSIDIISDLADVSLDEVKNLIAQFEKEKN